MNKIKQTLKQTIIEKFSLADYVAFLCGIFLVGLGVYAIATSEGYDDVWKHLLLIAVGNVQLYAPKLMISLFKQRIGISDGKQLENKDNE